MKVLKQTLVLVLCVTLIASSLPLDGLAAGLDAGVYLVDEQSEEVVEEEVTEDLPEEEMENAGAEIEQTQQSISGNELEETDDTKENGQEDMDPAGNADFEEKIISDDIPDSEIIDEEAVQSEEAIQDEETVQMLRAALNFDTSDYKTLYGASYEELFMKCPQYLDNVEFEENVLSRMKEIGGEAFRVGTADEKTAEFMHKMQEGLYYPVKTFLGEANIVESEYKTYQREVATQVVLDYLKTKEAETAVLEQINDNLGKINQGYSNSTKLPEFVELISGADGLEFYRQQGTGMTGEIITAISDAEPVMKYVQEGFSLFDIATQVMVSQQIEVSTIDFLIESMKYNDDAEIVRGLELLREDIVKDPVQSILEKYCTEKVIGAIVKLLESAIGGGMPAVSYAIDIIAMIYHISHPTFEQIEKSYISLIYMVDMEASIGFYKKWFKGKKLSARDIMLYEANYSLYLSTIKIYMNTAGACLKGTKHNNLRNRIEMWSEEIGKAVTYETYIVQCMKTIKKDIDNGTLTISDTGSTLPSDTEGYDSTESIAARFAAIQAQFPAGTTWTGSWGGAIQCFGFARMVFSKLFGCEMPAAYIGSAKYKYANESNVNLVGQLVGSDVTEGNVKSLFSNAKLGDVIQAYGSTYGQHTMVFVGATDSGVMVYDCNTQMGSEPPCTIHQWQINWNTWVSFYGTGTAESQNGISVYRASIYASIYGDGDGMFYDDSVNFVIDANGTLTKYNGWQRFVVIPDTVKAIGDNAFKNNTTMMSVEIPDGVKSIGKSAFEGCSSLIGVVIPDSVETIGEYAFYNCTGMGTVHLPEIMTEIKKSTFENCSLLGKIDIPEYVIEIEGKAFKSCSSLKEVKLSEGIVTLGSETFGRCISLEHIKIPKSINADNIVWYSNNLGPFSNCDKLKTIEFEEGITKIANSLFAKCNGLAEISIPDTVTEIGRRAFTECLNLRRVQVGEYVQVIEERTFADCSKLEKIEFGSEIRTIESEAFVNCTNLSGLFLPDKLKTLGYATFRNCSSLTEIIIPKSLDMSNVAWFSGDCGPFAYCNNLEKVDFEVGCESVTNSLFANCKGLKEINIPDSIKKIGARAFIGCENLLKVNMLDGLEDINDMAFDGCIALKEAYIPNTVTNMGTAVFSGCTSLEKVHLPEGRQNITANTFYNCRNLSEVNFPDTLTAVRQNAFYNCDALTEAILPEGVTTIEANAFQDCDGLTKVVTPDTITTIGNYAFQSCDELAEVKLGMGLTAVNSYSFADCGKLPSILVPYNVTKIGSSAFANNPKMLEITIPRKTTSIDSSAFSYKTKTTVYGITGTYVQTFAEANSMIFVPIDVPATSLVLNKESAEVDKYKTSQLTATVEPSNFTDEVIWSSSDTSIATVSDTGLVSAKKGGIVTITVKAGALQKSCEVKVNQPVTDIYLDEWYIDIEVGEIAQLNAEIYPDDATDQTITWSSSDESVAIVSDTGKITAIGEGVATITAKAGEAEDYCEVTVSAATEKTYVESITLSPSKLSMAVGEEYYVSKSVLPSNASNKNVIWSSSDTSVVRVSGGYITALKEGTAQIVATASDGSNVKGTCAVTVVKADQTVSTVDELQSNHPYSDDCDRSWRYTVANASELSVTFSKDTEVEENYDFIYIYDGKGNLIGTYTGDELAGKTIKVSGDTIKVRLVTDDSGTGYGYKVDKLAPVTSNSQGGGSNPDNPQQPSTPNTPKPEQPAQPIKITKLKLSGISKQIAAGKKITLTPSVTPKNATNQALSWKTSNKKYATVSKKGVVTLKKAGIGKTVTITATANDGSKKKATYKIKIMKHVVKSVKLKASAKTIKAGKSLKVKATVKTNGKSVNKKLQWTSSNTKYATVSSKGTVKAKKAGKGKRVTITARSTDGSNKKASIKLKIK